MMKRICALLALLLTLCASCAGAEMSGEIWMQEWRLVPQEDGSYLLHMVLGKDGAPVEIGPSTVVFFDAEGVNIPVQSVEMISSPLTTLPEGVHYFPMTVRVVPEEDAEIADVRVTDMQTAWPEEPLPVMCNGNPGHFMMKTDEGDMMVAFMTAFAGEDASAYVGYAFVYDREGNYLGNVELPRGRALFVPGDEMLSALAQNVGWSEVQLLRAGFPSRFEEDCVLFAGVPMSGLPRGVAPGMAYVYIYGWETTPARVLEITGFTIRTGEGAFRIEALATNMSGESVRLEGVSYVMLQDEAGQVRTCEAVTVEAPFRTVAPGESLPFVLTGALEEGFVPVACGFDTVCEPVDAPDHELLDDGSVPEGTQVEDVIAVTVCTDRRTGELYGVEWTQPGQVILAQGRLSAPEGDLVDEAPEGARFRQTFHRLIPAE